MGPAGGGINIVYASASNPCSSGDQAQRAGKPGYQRQSQGRADWMAGQPADQFRHRDGAAHLTSKGMLIGRGGRAAAFTPVTDSTLGACQGNANRSEEHTSDLQSLMRISYAVFCLKKKKTQQSQLVVTLSVFKKTADKL